MRAWASHGLHITTMRAARRRPCRSVQWCDQYQTRACISLNATRIDLRHPRVRRMPQLEHGHVLTPATSMPMSHAAYVNRSFTGNAPITVIGTCQRLAQSSRARLQRVCVRVLIATYAYASLSQAALCWPYHAAADVGAHCKQTGCSSGSTCSSACASGSGCTLQGTNQSHHQGDTCEQQQTHQRHCPQHHQCCSACVTM